MKKFISFILLIIIVFSACSTSEKISSTQEIPQDNTADYYADKIEYLKVDEINSSTTDSLKKMISKKIQIISEKNFDAIILDVGVTSYLNTPDEIQKTIEILSIAAEIAKQHNLFFYIKIDYKNIDKSDIKNSDYIQLKSFVKNLSLNCNSDGYLFTGFDFTLNDSELLFEDLIAENLVIKPYLLIALSNKSEKTTVENNFIKEGVVDFFVDEQNNYKLFVNHFYDMKGNQKVLKSYLKQLPPEMFFSLRLTNFLPLSNITLINENRQLKLNDENKINFITSAKLDTVKLLIDGKRIYLPMNEWVIPFNFRIEKDLTGSREGIWVEYRRPFSRITTNDIYNLLCKTDFPNAAFINGDSVHVYKTGVFFKKIKLQEGLNSLHTLVKDNSGKTALYEDRVFYKKPDPTMQTLDLFINENSIEPNKTLSLLPEDNLIVSFIGSKNKKGVVELSPGNYKFECNSKETGNFSKYEIQIPLRKLETNKNYSIKLILTSEESNSNLKAVEKTLPNYLLIKKLDDYPHLITVQDNSLFTFTLAPIRLGAPIRNELPKDVILKSNGMFGDTYRVVLSETEEGYIDKEFVNELPVNSVTPSYFINPITGFSKNDSDVIQIPYLENVPYETYADPINKRIVITLFGVKTSSTWIIHRNKLRYVEEITWEQTSKETYKIYVNLTTSKIWGYELKPNGKQLVFKLKYPPQYDLNSTLPLKGIKISIEAGHGGSNIGAVGLSGIKEKEINLKLSKLLENLFVKNGADVVQVRDSDKDMFLSEKRDIAINSNANLHFSVHANSSEPTNEFLGTSGTCTFYHNPFWSIFAEKVFERLIELDLKPFGSVGSFNYRVTRMTEMPSILVEQAFMSHAEDEEKLSDDQFRNQMAEKIFNGLIDYLKYMNE